MNSSAGRAKYQRFLLVSALAALLSLVFAEWPEIYAFDAPTTGSDVARLAHSPVHLTDDVMISLRTGYILNETGRPAFNRNDLAQPSTSLAAPYVYAALLRLLPDNAATGAYALLGLLAAAGSLGLIVAFARSAVNGALAALALYLTRTHLIYSLNGWDHLFQGCLITGATCLALEERPSNARLLLCALVLALGVCFRGDALPIALALLFVQYTASGNWRRFVGWALLPFSVLFLGALAVNWAQFGHLTPTTTRLKIGAAPSFIYAAKYALSNAVNYSALSLLLLGFAFYFLFRPVLDQGRRRLPLVIACALCAAFALVNSDVFPAGRMYWTPACVLLALLARTAPPLFAGSRDALKDVFKLSPSYQQRVRHWPSHVQRWAPRAALAGITLLGLFWFVPAAELRLRQAALNHETRGQSRIASQFVTARWIAQNLNPADGAIGFFFLGVSYYLPTFEIADFLGKADERIATTDVKWGLPGHNKWDIDATLAKWKPQAIVPSGALNPRAPGAIEKAQAALASRQDFGFSPALIVNPQIQQAYAYCYATDSRGAPEPSGFFLKREIAARAAPGLRCE